MLIRTAETPNPATRKFLPGRTVMEAGTRDFPDAASAAASPLAQAMFRAKFQWATAQQERRGVPMDGATLAHIRDYVSRTFKKS